MSHGCINMKTSEAKWLYNWAPKGTLVVIHK
jgi:lipoprotein-anchoring transpeptidase ErfK/SrfK